eukprot:m.194970 g.194970  ORF g.194970 m.194970 type:complete len:81 (+) comp25028_c4_seq2:1553-1795(+)
MAGIIKAAALVVVVVVGRGVATAGVAMAEVECESSSLVTQDPAPLRTRFSSLYIDYHIYTLLLYVRCMGAHSGELCASPS